MAARERISVHKRRIIMLIAVILAAAAVGLNYWRTPSFDLAMLFIILPSIFFGVAAALSLYRPISVIAILGQIAAFYWPLAKQLASAGEVGGMASTSLLLNDVMLIGIGMAALTMVSFVLLIFVLFQRRWGSVIEASPEPG